MWFDCGIELVFDHTTLHTRPALFSVDLQNLVHVLGGVYHQTVGERLAVGASAAAAWAEHYCLKLGHLTEAGNFYQVGSIARVEHTLWQYLIDGVIRRQYRAVGVVRVQVTAKT